VTFLRAEYRHSLTQKCVYTRSIAKPASRFVGYLKPKLVYVIFNNSVRAAKKTQHFTITKINWLTLFKEIIAVYRENHTTLINTNCRVTDEAGGTYSYHWA
jgi:hypothetical protein